MKRPLDLLPRVLPCANLDELRREGINISTIEIGIALRQFFPLHQEYQAGPCVAKKRKARRPGPESLEDRIVWAYRALSTEQRSLPGKRLRDELREKFKEMFGRGVSDKTFQRHGF